MGKMTGGVVSKDLSKEAAVEKTLESNEKGDHEDIWEEQGRK